MFSLRGQAAAAPPSPTLPSHTASVHNHPGHWICYAQVPSALERGQKRTAWFWPHSMSAFERLPWSEGHPLCPTQELSAKGAPVAAERTRPQPDCCEGFRQAVPGGRGLEAGGASCPPCTGRRGALSQLCSIHIATYSPATQASRLREGTEG